MDSSDPPALFNDSIFTIMKERTPLNQVMAFKASDMQSVMQLVQRVVQKSCRRACQLFCCPLGSLWCQKVTCCPAEKHQLTEERTRQVALRNPTSTILIVNISNSTLIDCVIGNNTYPSSMAESQPLMQETGIHMQNKMRCSYNHEHQGAAQTPPPPPFCPPGPPEEPPSINIQGSHLNCVIIGDNNYMHAEQINSTEKEEL